VTYSLTGTDADDFEIDKDTGVVTFKASPNFEAPTDSDKDNVYTVTFVASDGTNTDTQDISVTVTNLNEAPTDITLTASEVNDGDVGGNFIGNVNVTDPNGNGGFLEFDLVLTDDADGKFTLTNGSLQVAPGVTIDSDAPGSPTSYDIKVKATDKDDPTLFIEKTLTLTVVSVDEAPSKPELDNQQAIDENADNGTVVGDLSSLDPEGATVTLTVNGNPAFAVVGNQLVVADGSLLDYEAGSTVEVLVIAEDETGHQSNETFTVQLKDVNEAPTDVVITDPVTSLNENTVVAGGLKVGDITVLGDALNNAFSLAGPDKTSFAIMDGANGKELWFFGDGAPPNFEVKSSYAVSVVVEDDAFPGVSVSTNFTLEIENADDPPQGTVTINAGGDGVPQQGETLTAISSITDEDGIVSGSVTSNGIGPTIRAAASKRKLPAPHRRSMLRRKPMSASSCGRWHSTTTISAPSLKASRAATRARSRTSTTLRPARRRSQSRRSTRTRPSSSPARTWCRVSPISTATA
jgi:hypothetical protein